MRCLIISLLCLASCGSGTDPAPPPKPAQSLSWDFEAGTFPNPADQPNLVPPVVLTEINGNHYGRLTGSPSDCSTTDFILWDPCPQIREQVRIWTIPEVEGETRTFSLTVRIPSAGQPATGHDSMLWQLLEPGPNSTRTIWFGIRDFGAGQHFYVANQVPPCPTGCTYIPVIAKGDYANVVDLGPVVFDQWMTIQLDMTLAATPTNGTLIVRKNGAVVQTISNQPTTWLPTGLTQDVKIDVLDWSGTLGIADFDNLSAEEN